MGFEKAHSPLCQDQVILSSKPFLSETSFVPSPLRNGEIDELESGLGSIFAALNKNIALPNIIMQKTTAMDFRKCSHNFPVLGTIQLIHLDRGAGNLCRNRKKQISVAASRHEPWDVPSLQLLQVVVNFNLCHQFLFIVRLLRNIA